MWLARRWGWLAGLWLMLLLASGAGACAGEPADDGLEGGVGGSSESPAPTTSATATPRPDGRLRAAYLLARQRAAGPAYAVGRSGAPLHADNPAQGLSIRFGSQIELTPRSSNWVAGLSVDGFGCVGAVRPVAASEPVKDRAQSNQVWQDHGPLAAWYLNGPLGLQQGFEIRERPACADESRVRVRVAVSGLSPRRGTRHPVILSTADGRPAMHVDGLHVVDASGRILDAELGVEGEAVVVDVDVTDAAFPISIDPVWAQQTKLTVEADNAAEYFGSEVSLSGNTALIAAPRNDEHDYDAGAAFVFVNTAGTWVLQQKLLAPDGGDRGFFGTSVSLSGDTALIGARGDDDAGSFSGAAYVFVRSGSTWTLEQKLVAPDGAAGDNLGTAVSVSGDTALLGAPYDDDQGSNTGSVYVYVRNGGVWTLEQKLLSSSTTTGQRFGDRVVLAGDDALVGSFNIDHVHVFVRSGATWSLQQVLSSGAPNDTFGCSMSISGDTVAVGACDADEMGFDSGAAYVFVRSGTTWTLEQKLVPSDGDASDEFGTSVSLSGDTLLIGALRHTSVGNDEGAVYAYTRAGATWTLEQKFVPLDAANSDYFGGSVSLEGDTVLVGAANVNDAGDDAGAAYLWSRSGGVWSQDQKLIDTEGLTGEPVDGMRAGESVSLWGDRAAVGAIFGDSGPPDNQGAVYLYERMAGMWVQQDKLVAIDGAVADRFGLAVSLDGDTVVAGAPFHDAVAADAGAAYVFVHDGTTWMLEQKLVAPDGDVEDEFGDVVSLSGDTVVVGVAEDSDLGPSSGSAYVFVRSGTTWALEQKLVAPDGAASDRFGYSVSISGDTLLVGSRLDDDLGNSSGSAHVFVRTAGVWSHQQKLLASDGAAADQFGEAVSVDGDTALVGAPRDDDNGSSSGSAYLFVRSGTTWTAEQKLTPLDGTASDQFGQAVQVSGDRAVIGAFTDDAVAPIAGSAYVFERSGGVWTQDQKLLAADGAEGDRFGSSVALAGDTVLVGSPLDDDEGLTSGSAYVFIVIDSVSCTQDTDCTTGFCRDGVCCNTSCGGTVSDDCQACANALTGSSDGVCAPILAGTECRAAGGACDVAEQCDGTTLSCPADSFVAAGIACRPAVDICDVAEQCTGMDATCPVDDKVAPGTQCRPSAGSCDVAESCDGVSDVCPPDAFLPAATICRAAADVCDEQETCNGSSGACPPDGFLPATTVCRAATGVCDEEETCDGVSGACPSDAFLPPTTVCRAATDVCDEVETCTGAGGSCPPDAVAAATVICRATAGSCDLAELCDGTTKTCPVDLLASMGSLGNPSCAPYLCDGANTSCATTCATKADCADGFYCDAGTCLSELAIGEVCTTGDSCATDFCVDGVCCDAACGGGDTGDCQACSASETGMADGTCAPSQAGVVCRASIDACDAEEQCDGAAIECPGDVLEAAGTECRPADGACDQPENCSGDDAACPIDELAPAGTICREAAGECDVEEHCDGTESTCPADELVPAQSVCRAAANDCDAEERCDGSGALCPADEAAADGSTCDDGDACTTEDYCDAGLCRSGPDVCGAGGGEPGPAPAPESESGCSCRVAGTGSPGGARGLVSLAFLALVLTRRRRRRHGALGGPRESPATSPNPWPLLS